MGLRFYAGCFVVLTTAAAALGIVDQIRLNFRRGSTEGMSWGRYAFRALDNMAWITALLGGARDWALLGTTIGVQLLCFVVLLQTATLGPRRKLTARVAAIAIVVLGIGLIVARPPLPFSPAVLPLVTCCIFVVPGISAQLRLNWRRKSIEGVSRAEMLIFGSNCIIWAAYCVATTSPLIALASVMNGGLGLALIGQAWHYGRKKG
jgi:tryptophan-rich sensory protein